MVYLAGTKHMIQAEEIPLPSTYYAAYQAADTIYVEDASADHLNWLDKTLLIVKMFPRVARTASAFYCAKGQSLADHLSDETIGQLQAHYGDAYHTLRRYTPLGLVFLETTEQWERVFG